MELRATEEGRFEGGGKKSWTSGRARERLSVGLEEF